MTRNPYRRISKFLSATKRVTGVALGALLLLAAFVVWPIWALASGVSGFAAFVWWIAVGIVTGVYAFFGLIAALWEYLKEKWDDKMYDWDKKNS